MDTPVKPILVRDTAKPDIFWQTVRVGLLIGCGLLIGRYLPDVVVGAALPGLDQILVGVLGIVGTYWVGLKKMLRDNKKLRELASKVPDEAAILVRK